MQRGRHVIRNWDRIREKTKQLTHETRWILFLLRRNFDRASKTDFEVNFVDEIYRKKVYFWYTVSRAYLSHSHSNRLRFLNLVWVKKICKEVMIVLRGTPSTDDQVTDVMTMNIKHNWGSGFMYNEHLKNKELKDQEKEARRDETW